MKEWLEIWYKLYFLYFNFFVAKIKAFPKSRIFKAVFYTRAFVNSLAHFDFFNFVLRLSILKDIFYRSFL